MLLLRTTTVTRTCLRAPVHRLFLTTTIYRSMSSSAYILPFDPSSPSSSVQGVDVQKLWSTIPSAKTPKEGTAKVFYGAGPDGSAAVLTSLGENWSGKKGPERREIFRKAVGSGVKAVKSLDGVKEIKVDAAIDPHAAGNVALYLEHAL